MVELFVSLGMLIIIVGIAVLLVGIILQAKSGKAKIEGGGILFIGPFPIIGGATNRQIFYILITVSLIMMIAFLLIGRKV